MLSAAPSKAGVEYTDENGGGLGVRLWMVKRKSE
jgi:hypothetical protein